MNNSEVLFYEKQYFRQLWVKLLLFAILGFQMYALYSQLLLNKPVGNNPVSDIYLIIITLFLGAFTVFFFFIHMKTTVTKEGVYVQSYPFHLKPRFFAWKTIKSAYARKYKPIREYGGWGIRFGFGSKGMAYNMHGDMGIQFEFENGKKLLVGSQKTAEFEAAIYKELKLQNEK